MITVRKRAALAFVIIAFKFPAFACSITITEHFKYAFKQAPIVFYGTVLRIDADGTTHFRVHRQWKGQPVSAVAGPNSQTSCAYDGLRIGSRYVVVPEPDESMKAGTHIEESNPNSPTAKLLGSRASWWRSPLSSLMPGAILRAISRRMP